MIEKYKVKLEDLRLDSMLKNKDFKTTKDVQPLKGIIGQERAVESMNFGLKMKKKGYNIYVCGISGTGRTSYTNSLVEKIAKSKKSNRDWVYVYNFKSPNEPVALSFESGIGKEFKKDIEDITDKLKEEVLKVFSSKEYDIRIKHLEEEYENMINDVVDKLNSFASEKGFLFEITATGLVSTPIKEDGCLMNDDEYEKLSNEEYNEIKERANALGKEIGDYTKEIKKIDDIFRTNLLELDKKIAENTVCSYIDVLNEKYGGIEKIDTYLKYFKEDIIENIIMFKPNEVDEESKSADNEMINVQVNDRGKFFLRYKVNLFIDSSDLEGASIVSETNPTYYNLIGAIEYKNEMGILTTNFLQLKPGALHKANGGFLILNVKDLFSNQFVFEALKRSLKESNVKMETLNKQSNYIVTSTLKPEPIEIDVKVILIGDSNTYSVLYNYDEDFRKLFKIMADFDIEIDKNEENAYKIARFICAHCERENLKHFTKDAVEKVIEYSSRICEDREKLSARFNRIVDMLHEADALSDEENIYVTDKDVLKAINSRKYRNNKYEEKVNEMINKGTLLIDVEGEKIGQINGLAVFGGPAYSFGKPSKITASTYKGKYGVINIEREIEHSGSTHDKGVLILSGYLGERYGRERTISLTSSITFEQNYNGIDGDSASSTELYAIISSIGAIPIKQYIAVTGSVNQKGEIQPIGGVNEKIEGFFDVCKMKGLNKKHGVIIPIQNVDNLILREDVVDAIENNEFNIYAISHVDEGLEILTGLEKEEIDEKINAFLEKLSKINKKVKLESQSI